MTTDTLSLEKFTVTQIATALSTLTGETVSPKAFNYKGKALARLEALMKERKLTLRDILVAAGIEAVTPEGEPLSGLGMEQDVAAAEAKFTKPRHRENSKQAKLIEMLKRPQGADIAEIAATFKWQSHSVRGAISGALRKKLGLTVISEKVDGLGLETLEARKSDSLDFHDLAVWSVKEALEAAYEAGLAVGRTPCPPTT